MTPEQTQTRKQVYAAAAAFLAKHPELIPSEENEERLHELMQICDIPFTVAGYERAFKELKDELDLLPAKQKPATAGPRTVAGIEITHASLAQLTAKQLERLLNNPEFVAAVDSLPRR